MVEHNPSGSITLNDLDSVFVEGSVCVGLSMIPVEKGSLVGVVNLRGEIL